MSPKDKELVAIGISVAAGCKPCTDHHVSVARKARATDDEIRSAIGNALEIRRRAADIMEFHALAHLGEKRETRGLDSVGQGRRVEALTALGAAYAVNCVTSLERQLAAAEQSGISREDISEIVKLAVFIKRKAASHVGRLVGMSEEQAA